MNIWKMYPPRTGRNSFPWPRVWIDAESIGYWWNPKIAPGRTWPVGWTSMPAFLQQMENDAWKGEPEEWFYL